MSVAEKSRMYGRDGIQTKGKIYKMHIHRIYENGRRWIQSDIIIHFSSDGKMDSLEIGCNF